MKKRMAACPLALVGVIAWAGAAGAQDDRAQYERPAAHDEGGTALLREATFREIEGLIEKALADLGVKPTDRIAYIKVVRHNEKEMLANGSAALKEEALFVGRAADDYRKPPVELKNGPTISELMPENASVKAKFNPECTLKKVGSKYKLVPPGCDN